jgi:hypothetical protein
MPLNLRQTALIPTQKDVVLPFSVACNNPSSSNDFKPASLGSMASTLPLDHRGRQGYLQSKTVAYHVSFPVFMECNLCEHTMGTGGPFPGGKSAAGA